MNRVFGAGAPSVVADGTIVRPLLNPLDERSRLEPELLGGFSIAQGEIAPQSQSLIHIHPAVDVVTLVLAGELRVTMKDAAHEAPYTLVLGEAQAALCERGTFLQLANTSKTWCQVVYIVSPPYVLMHDQEDGFEYEDAIVLNDDWAALARQNWQPPELARIELLKERRRAAKTRLVARTRHDRGTL